MPYAILAIVEAVAGATMKRSAQSPSSTWLCHVPSLWSKKSHSTGRPERVERVSGVMNSLAAAVITTCTSAPALTRSRIREAAL